MRIIESILPNKRQKKAQKYCLKGLAKHYWILNFFVYRINSMINFKIVECIILDFNLLNEIKRKNSSNFFNLLIQEREVIKSAPCKMYKKKLDSS